jgi:hypothetical protein
MVLYKRCGYNGAEAVCVSRLSAVRCAARSCLCNPRIITLPEDTKTTLQRIKGYHRTLLVRRVNAMFWRSTKAATGGVLHLLPFGLVCSAAGRVGRGIAEDDDDDDANEAARDDPEEVDTSASFVGSP